MCFIYRPVRVKQEKTWLFKRPIIAEAIQNFKLYPNPASNVLNVDLGDLNTSAIIKVYSSEGLLLRTVNTVANQKNVQLNVSGLAKGSLYFKYNNRQRNEIL